jgi:F5/8 type C domain
MVRADDKRDPPRPPPWTKFGGKWAAQAGNPYGPSLASALTWSPPARDDGLGAARKASDALNDAMNKLTALQQQDQALDASLTQTKAVPQIGGLMNPIISMLQGQLNAIKQQEATQTAVVASLQAKANAAAAAVTLDTSTWSVTADSFQAGYEPQKVLESDPQTFWHTHFTPPVPPYPHSITIDMKSRHMLNGLKYLPRQDNTLNGTIGQYTIETSLDNQTWTAVASGTWANNASLKTTSFTSAWAQYIRITAHKESQNTNNPWSSCAQLSVQVDPNPEKARAAMEAQTVAEAARRAQEQVLQGIAAVVKAAALAPGIAPPPLGSPAVAIPVSDAIRAIEEKHAAQNAAIKAVLDQTRATQEAAALAVANAQAAAAAKAKADADAAAAAAAATKVKADADVAAAIAAAAAAKAKADQEAAAAKAKADQEAAASKAKADQEAANKAKQTAFTYTGYVDAAMYGPKDVTVLVRTAYTQWTANPLNAGRPFTMLVSNSSMGGDPAFGQVKTCRVLFQRSARNDPLHTTQAVVRQASENQTLTLDLNSIAAPEVDADNQRRAGVLRQLTPPPQVPHGEILGATYGPKDVTSFVQTAYNRAPQGKPFGFTVSYLALGGDPQPGVPKTLTVLWRKFAPVNVIDSSVYEVLAGGENKVLEFK